MTNKDCIKASISLHSQGEMLLTSWGYTNKLPSDNELLLSIGNAAAAAIKKVNGRDYTVGPAGAVLYPAGGASDDFAKGTAGVTFAVTVELPGGGGRQVSYSGIFYRNGGRTNSFPACSNPWGLDRSKIKGVGEEMWEASKVFASEAKKL